MHRTRCKQLSFCDLDSQRAQQAQQAQRGPATHMMVVVVVLEAVVVAGEGTAVVAAEGTVVVMEAWVVMEDTTSGFAGSVGGRQRSWPQEWVPPR